MPKKECIAMLLAGGQGSRMGNLTRNMAKPAVSFGGKYRIIDFSLSNCANSNIDTVGVLTQYMPFTLNSYIGIGSAWDLDNLYILSPYTKEKGGRWYKGTADAIYQNIDFIDFFNPDYVLIISGDHIYKMDYSLLLQFHKEKKAEATISVVEVPWEETSRFGILSADEDGRIFEFVEKPTVPQSNLASMGIYVFNWPVLKRALFEDQANSGSDNDFGKNVIPMLLGQGKRLFAYCFQGYWRDIGTIDSYYKANMELLTDSPPLNIFDLGFKLYSKEEALPPHYAGPKANVKKSLISNGCTVLGEVVNSVLAPGVFVGSGAKIEDSILLPNAKILSESLVYRTIVGENAEIRENCRIGMNIGGKQHQRAITVIGNNCLIPVDSLIEAGSKIPNDINMTDTCDAVAVSLEL